MLIHRIQQHLENIHEDQVGFVTIEEFQHMKGGIYMIASAGTEKASDSSVLS